MLTTSSSGRSTKAQEPSSAGMSGDGEDAEGVVEDGELQSEYGIGAKIQYDKNVDIRMQ